MPGCQCSSSVRDIISVLVTNLTFLKVSDLSEFGSCIITLTRTWVGLRRRLNFDNIVTQVIYKFRTWCQNVSKLSNHVIHFTFFFRENLMSKLHLNRILDTSSYKIVLAHKCQCKILFPSFMASEIWLSAKFRQTELLQARASGLCFY